MLFADEEQVMGLRRPTPPRGWNIRVSRSKYRPVGLRESARDTQQEPPPNENQHIVHHAEGDAAKRVNADCGAVRQGHQENRHFEMQTALQ